MSSDQSEKFCAEIGKRLQREREALGYSSQERLGDAISKSKRTITNWESGVSTPNACDLLILANLGFDIGFIVLGVRSGFVLSDAATPTYVTAKATPGRLAAEEISGMALSSQDADVVVSIARRLAEKG